YFATTLITKCATFGSLLRRYSDSSGDRTPRSVLPELRPREAREAALGSRQPALHQTLLCLSCPVIACFSLIVSEPYYCSGLPSCPGLHRAPAVPAAFAFDFAE